MAVDYTKVFTLIGNTVARLNAYFAYLTTFDTDQTNTENLYSAQSVVRLVDGLDSDVYESLRSDIVGWVSKLISRTDLVLLDSELVTNNFQLGTSPGITTILPAIVEDMVLGTKHVKPSVATVGSVTKTTSAYSAYCGNLMVGTLLDGVTPAVEGGISFAANAGFTTQMTPDAETLKFVCTSSAQDGATVGSETFDVTGIGPASSAYSVAGEHVGSAGTLVVADNNSVTYGTNLDFSAWADSSLPPDGWTDSFGVDPVNQSYVQTIVAAENLGTPGYAIKTVEAVKTMQIRTELVTESLIERRGYFLSVMVKKLNGAKTNPTVNITITNGDASTIASLNVTATSTILWTHGYLQFIAPQKVVGPVALYVNVSCNTTISAMAIDNIVIAPCTYIAGVGFAIVRGEQDFVAGDKFQINLSNNNAGKFQTFFRKAYKAQLPTNASPSISDSLVT